MSEASAKRYYYAGLWLRYCRANGVRFRVCGVGPDADLQISDRFRFLSADQRAEMAEYRQEIGMLVTVDELTIPVTTLDSFALSGRVIWIESAVLGCPVMLAADNAQIPVTQDVPVYRASELSALMQDPPCPEGLRQLHGIKMQFDGQIVRVD